MDMLVWLLRDSEGMVNDVRIKSNPGTKPNDEAVTDAMLAFSRHCLRSTLANRGGSSVG